MTTHFSSSLSTATSSSRNGTDIGEKPVGSPRQQPAPRPRRSRQRRRLGLAMLLIRSGDAGRSSRWKQARIDACRRRYPSRPFGSAAVLGGPHIRKRTVSSGGRRSFSAAHSRQIRQGVCRFQLFRRRRKMRPRVVLTTVIGKRNIPYLSRAS